MKKIIAILFVTITITTTSKAQLGGLGKMIKEKALSNESPVANLLKAPSPITTSFKDVNMDGSLPETFANDTAYRSLMQLQRTPNGGFVLQPGFYEMTNRSYCLKAGTHGPSKGDGYMYAAVKGTQDDAVISILRNQVNRPGIDQHDIQLLLWAIIARAKFENLSTESKAVAALLLTPKQIATLNRDALGVVSDLASKTGSMPPAIQAILEAENKLRQMFASGMNNYEEFERIAVLAGMAEIDNPDVRRGKWSKHPDGYYIRYLPFSYPTTQVQIWVPQGSPAVGKEYDPAMHIACPANTGAQRLAQTGVQKSL